MIMAHVLWGLCCVSLRCWSVPLFESSNCTLFKQDCAIVVSGSGMKGSFVEESGLQEDVGRQHGRSVRSNMRSHLVRSAMIPLALGDCYAMETYSRCTEREVVREIGLILPRRTGRQKWT